LLALVLAAAVIPARAALALVSAVCSLIVAYEAIRYPARTGPGPAPRARGISAPPLLGEPRIWAR
jgi:hypothetical protein